MSYIPLLNHFVESCIAKPIRETVIPGINHMPVKKCPIGKINITSKGGNKYSKLNLPLYYFKGFDSKKKFKSIKGKTELINTTILHLRIPGEFQFVNVKITPNEVKLDTSGSIPKVHGIQLDESYNNNKYTVNNYQQGGINGLFAVGYNRKVFYTPSKRNEVYRSPLINNKLRKNQLKQLPNFHRNMKSSYAIDINSPSLKRLSSGEIDLIRFDPPVINPGPGGGGLPGGGWPDTHTPDILPIGNIGEEGCPFGFAGRLNPPPLDLFGAGSQTSSSKRQKGIISDTNITSLFFKFKNHYFTPIALPNGTTYYYAFENPEILKYWIYKYMAKESGFFDIAQRGPLYYENILGISICKFIELVQPESTNVKFWK